MFVDAAVGAHDASKFDFKTVPLKCLCVCMFLVLPHQVMFSGTLSSTQEHDLTCVTSVDEVPTHTHTHTIELMHNSDTQYFLLNVLLASYFDYQGGVSNIIAFKIS